MADDSTTTEAANQPVEISEEDLPKKLKDLYKKAKDAIEMNNHKYAVNLLQAILKESPGFVDGRRVLRSASAVVTGGPKKKGLFGGGGLGLMKLQGQSKKDPVGVLEPLEKELEKDPFNPAANELLFDSAIRANMLKTAAFALETVRKGSPENTKLLHRLAAFYMSRDMPDRAIGVYKDIAKQDPTDTDAIKGEKDATARASMQKQKSASGEYVLGKKSDEETLALEKAGRAALTREQLEEKVGGLLANYEADPNDLANVKDLAQTYEKMEDWANSYTFYDWAHQLSTNDVALKTKAESIKDKAAEAELRQLEEHIQTNPDDTEAAARLEELRSTRVAEQVTERQKRVEQNPTDPQLRFELGQALYHAGQFSDAIPHLQQATRNPHIRTRVLLLLGRTFDAKGMNDLAIKQLSDANDELIAMDNVKKEILYELGLIYAKIEDKEKALDCFKQIYEVDYGYRDVAQRVEQSYTG
ncbi:MAG: tetratricopeptide repeat protein [Akkermansiaceae bacterium]|nr:tetratricopeptide repeat protein [Akkermansiaceae bacterium]